MVMDRKGLLRLIITISISICICILAMVFLVKETITLSVIVKSILLGSGIWLIAEISFNLVEKLWPHNIFPSYLALMIIIGIGTISGLILFGIRSTGMIFLISSAAEVSGLGIAIISRQRYKAKLNEKLEEFKSQDNPFE